MELRTRTAEVPRAQGAFAAALGTCKIKHELEAGNRYVVGKLASTGLVCDADAIRVEEASDGQR